MIRSAHVDTFARDNLPPQDQWPEFLFTLPELQYPDRVNCVTEFVDKWVNSGQGGRTAIISPSETLTYAQLSERINRIANVLTRDLGLVPGNRVLLRSGNNPTMVAAYLAVMKAGGVTVATMPLVPQIVDAVGDRVEIILDGGVRRGADVLKALALGAKACMAGRPFLYGLAADGERGVRKALDLFRNEIDNNLALLGRPVARELDRTCLKWA